MPAFRTSTVASIEQERTGYQRILLDGGDPAYVLTDLIGPVAAGDEVVVNTTAVDLGLGTGGAHVVHWNLTRRQWSSVGSGHIIKLRYTSLQTDTGSTEETVGESLPQGLAGMPVVACGLHSQMAVAAVAFRDAAPVARLAYVMTDGASLPLALSDLVVKLRAAGVLDRTVTAGQSFGGELEAVNLYSALLVARDDGADAVVAGIGPGVVGTGTPFGHTGLDVSLIVNATAALGGRPIVAARMSGADERSRHHGQSHHTTSALAMALAPCHVADPVVEGVHDVAGMLARRGVSVTTMGRGPDEDPVFFDWAAAAGRAAARAVLGGALS